jgi:hypothetical protein
MTEQLQKIAESRGGVRRTGSIGWIGCVSSIFTRGANRLGHRRPLSRTGLAHGADHLSWGSVGARDLRPTRAHVVGSVGGLTRCFDWLTGRVMNNVCIYIYYNISPLISCADDYSCSLFCPPPRSSSVSPFDEVHACVGTCWRYLACSVESATLRVKQKLQLYILAKATLASSKRIRASIVASHFKRTIYIDCFQERRKEVHHHSENPHTYRLGGIKT